MSLNPCQYCVMLAKVSSAYRTGYACGIFARMPCLVKDLGHFLETYCKIRVNKEALSQNCLPGLEKGKMYGIL